MALIPLDVPPLSTSVLSTLSLVMPGLHDWCFTPTISAWAFIDVEHVIGMAVCAGIGLYPENGAAIAMVVGVRVQEILQEYLRHVMLVERSVRLSLKR